MSYRSLAILITALSSAPATAADLYVAPGGVYVGAGPVYVTPGPAAPPYGPAPYAAPGYVVPPPYVGPPPAVVAPAPTYGVLPPINGGVVYAPRHRRAYVGPSVYGYPGDYPAGYGYAGYDAGYGYAGYDVPRPPAVIPNGPPRCVYSDGFEYCR